MKQIIYGIILLNLILSSCHTVKSARHNSTLKVLSNPNIQLLKGTYQNQPLDDKLNKTYSSTHDANTLNDVQLLKQFFLLDEMESGIAEQVKINPISNNGLEISAMQGGKVVQQFRIKGKFSKGYFKTKKERKTKFPPLPPFYYFNENVRLYITIDTANNLVIKRRGKKTGMLFFFAAGFKMDNEYRYAPIRTLKKDSSILNPTNSLNANFPEGLLFIPQPSGDKITDQLLQKNIEKVNLIIADYKWYNIVWNDLEIGGEGGKVGYHVTSSEKVSIIFKIAYGETFRNEKGYFIDKNTGDLIYMTEQMYHYNSPIYYDEKTAKENEGTEAFDEKQSRVIVHHNYFEKGKLFYRINSNNEQENNNALENLGIEILKELNEIKP